MATLVIAPNSDYDNRMEIEMDTPDQSKINFRSELEPNTIQLYAQGCEMLRVAQDGFYVRGVKVPADDQEAVAVYNAFKQWMAWNVLERA